MSKDLDKQQSRKDNAEQKGSVLKPSFTTRPPSKENETPKKKN